MAYKPNIYKKYTKHKLKTNNSKIINQKYTENKPNRN